MRESDIRFGEPRDHPPGFRRSLCVPGWRFVRRSGRVATHSAIHATTPSLALSTALSPDHPPRIVRPHAIASRVAHNPMAKSVSSGAAEPPKIRSCRASTDRRAAETSRMNNAGRRFACPGCSVRRPRISMLANVTWLLPIMTQLWSTNP